MLPRRFNNPFSYEPHPLCLAAADEVMRYVTATEELRADAARGKMFGVLVVEAAVDAAPASHLHAAGSERLFFLAAYSGLLASRNDWAFFVPAVFDAQQPEGHFKTMERKISAISEALCHPGLSAAESESMKQQRKRMSEELQLWLFRQYRMLNARGETKDLVEIWRSYHVSPKLQQRFPLPPGGSGDCCAPKLLQYAFQHRLRPVAMAEFWYGESPQGEVRHHGQFYPACRGKCLPILSFMLQGLDVEPEQPGTSRCGGINSATALRTLYEDEHLLVIEKPSGMLSVPGRITAPSVQSLLSEQYAEVFMPHRLDMDTSGLMVVARTEEAYKRLQQQFFARTIYKRYVALLDGVAEKKKCGSISLPLRPDPLDCPRQVVDRLRGKQSLTDYEVLRVVERMLPDGRRARATLVSLVPHTGRTHQLRVHCAHPDGLGLPIVGDNLYGRKDSRLFLHAAELSFTHPATGKPMHFESEGFVSSRESCLSNSLSLQL